MSQHESAHQDEHDLDINEIDTGSLESTSISVNKLRIGGYILIEGRPCRAVDITKSKPGKHGHAKAKIAGSDVFTGRRFETTLPTSHDVEVPVVERNDYAVINIDGKNTQLLDIRGNMREDVELEDNEICNKLRSDMESSNGDEFIVTVISWTNESKIIEYRKSQS